MKLIRFYCLSLFCGLCVSTLSAQIIHDVNTQQIASQALQKIYSLDFAGAKALIVQIQQKYPTHPVVPFLFAYSLSWENAPLTKQMTVYAAYEKHIQNSLSQAQAMLKKNEYDIEGVFFVMMAYSLLAMHESESGTFMNSVNYGKKSFSYMKKGFKLTDRLADFHFSTGLYKYYAVQYPDTHPIAKPFMAFFPGGSKSEGLNHLRTASQIGQYSKVESLLYLTAIYAKYEQNHYYALECAQKLVNLYPQNPLFWVKYCEGLIALGRYAEAELYLSKFNTRTENLYQTANRTFRGLIQERYYKNLPNAQAEYTLAVKPEQYDARYSKDYIAFSYAGLARIADKNAQKSLAKDYYKKVSKLSEYEGLRKEAREYK
jgi:hypothetical protein